MMHEKFYKYLEETARIEKRLTTETDETLVEKLYYSYSGTDLPKDIVRILNAYIDTKKLSKNSRKKLENLYRLLYAEKNLEE